MQELITAIAVVRILGFQSALEMATTISAAATAEAILVRTMSTELVMVAFMAVDTLSTDQRRFILCQSIPLPFTVVDFGAVTVAIGTVVKHNSDAL